MAEPKTKKTDASVAAFLDAVADPRRREDAREVLALMKRITGEEPKMWGPSIVGFGSYTYTYASGQTGDWPIAGFSPRKQALTLYLMPGFEKDADLMKRLGKHKTGKSCLYLNRLADVDAGVLEELVRRSVERMRNRGA
ncbi:MAG TPA: DUF1801 domain-containing protein [Thermoanaerobaculia bacterium]|jgi:hypothetical protein|nr:DUF1801 domain-containing protein [Thermoanaerobaculia bacterium]HQN09470.1 DUF1801 domain-containing protein [Thermoanaerobaculia bacterium]HQP88878.1 DUF1801 domain-containing protein [Thermoanaerobaculia bacterium]